MTLPTDAPPSLADDLRSPLASIAANLQSVRRGAADRLDGPQRRSLEEALRLCQRAAALTHQIDDRGDQGPACSRPPAIGRIKIDVTALRGAVVEGLHESVANRLRWDVDAVDVHADPVWLARTLVAAITALQSGDPGDRMAGDFVITSVDQPDRGVTLWRVSGPGRATASDRTAMVAAARAAAAGMSDLAVDRDRSMTFTTPRHNHFAIAAAFARWRLSRIGQPRRPRPAGLIQDVTDDSEIVVATGWQPRRADRVAIGSVAAGAACHRQSLERFDRALSQSVTVWEWILRIDARTWVWALDSDHRLIVPRLHDLRGTTDRSIEGLRVTWSDPAIVPVQPRRLETRLIDLIAARSLAGSAMELSVDLNRVRAGTEPIRSSDVAARRLEDELRRLAGRMRRQTGRLRLENRQLRPPGG